MKKVILEETGAKSRTCSFYVMNVLKKAQGAPTPSLIIKCTEESVEGGAGHIADCMEGCGVFHRTIKEIDANHIPDTKLKEYIVDEIKTRCDNFFIKLSARVDELEYSLCTNETSSTNTSPDEKSSPRILQKRQKNRKVLDRTQNRREAARDGHTSPIPSPITKKSSYQ